MNKHIIFHIILIFLLGVSVTSAQTDLQIGARPQGMGGAYVALAYDADAVYWNPAGLSFIYGGDIRFMHWTFEEISQIMVDYLAVSYPFYKGGVGFSWIRQGAELEQGRLGEKSIMSENSFLLSYGLRLSNRISIGTSLNRRVIYSQEGSGAGIGFDFGTLISLVPDLWTLGVVAKNVAANMKNESLDPNLYFGTAFQFGTYDNTHNFTLAADINTMKDVDGVEGTSLKYATGLEYMLRLNTFSFAVRGGMGTKNYALGFGMGINNICIDYAYVMMRENTIGNSHKIGLSFKFGQTGAPEKAVRRKEKPSEPSETGKAFKLQGQQVDDRIVLKWNTVKGSQGYHIFGRITGQDWKRLSKKLVQSTGIALPLSSKGKNVKLELKVRAVANGNYIAESNSVTFN
ncbi:MAG: PorV/PorQ family protein [bacterium]